MIKVKVIKSFKDKYTKVLHEKGSELTISNERYEELNSSAHGILVKEIKEVNFDKMIKTELVEYASKIGIELNMEMTKAKMIELLKSR